MIRLFAGAAVVAAVISATTLRGQSATNRFGFTGPEIFPIDPQISLLRGADLDGDGYNDLIVVDNAHSKIELLYNQTGSTNRARPVVAGVRKELNELPPDARFRISSIASEKRIAALVVEDLNGDGRPDIAYYGGDPREVEILYNLGTNGWSEPKRWEIDDGQLSANALAAGDINGDHLTDLVLLGDSQIYVFKQKPDHTMADPEKIPFSGNVKAIQVTDIDGDGRKDLLEVNWESPTPFRFRLQDDTGHLGPEYYFSFPPVRSFWADQLEQDNKTQVITIAQSSGRAQVSEFVRKPAEALSGSLKAGQFQVLPLNKTDKAKRGMLWADINGDKLPDLLVAEPESGQISIYLQRPDGTLAAPRTFSTFTGVSDLAVGDWDGDGKPDLFLLSADERQVGVTHMDSRGGLPFPTLIPMDGKPLAMAVGSLKPGEKPTLAVILDQDNRRSLLTRQADGKTRVQKLSENFKSNPSSMIFHDANQDGLADLVVLIPYEKIKVLLQTSSGYFDEQDVPAPGGSVEQPWMTTADIDGDGKPELLLAQKNFLRAVVLKQEAPPPDSTNRGSWVFSVKEQINGAGSSSRLIGATALPNPGHAVSSIFLLDADRKALTLSERDNSGVWQVVRNLPLPLTDFTSLQSIALGGPNLNSVAFLGNNAAAWMEFQGNVWDFSELDGYETPIKDGRLNDVLSGDLDNDGRKDLVFLETTKNYLDVVTFDKNRKLVPANRWQVFEERSFRGRRNDLPEPREGLIMDVTGDHKNDLIILVHDRILVYPQE